MSRRALEQWYVARCGAVLYRTGAVRAAGAAVMPGPRGRVAAMVISPADKRDAASARSASSMLPLGWAASRVASRTAPSRNGAA